MSAYRTAPPVDRGCPRCKLALTDREVASVRVSECTRCGGLFVPKDTVAELAGDPERRARARAELPDGEVSPHPGGPLYVPCPECGTLMNRGQFVFGVNVIVDRCRAHGVWFDAGELRKVLDWAASDGPEKVRAKQEEGRTVQARKARTTELIAAVLRYEISRSRDIWVSMFEPWWK